MYAKKFGRSVSIRFFCLTIVLNTVAVVDVASLYCICVMFIGADEKSGVLHFLLFHI